MQYQRVNVRPAWCVNGLRAVTPLKSPIRYHGLYNSVGRMGRGQVLDARYPAVLPLLLYRLGKCQSQGVPDVRRQLEPCFDLRLFFKNDLVIGIEPELGRADMGMQ